jgi:hypothetical protein
MREQLKTSFPKVIVCFLVLSVSHSRFQKPTNYSVDQALKVFQYIKKLEKARLESGRNKLDSIVVTESELNSYIAYRIETENEEIMKQLYMKILNNNRIEGKILIDLRGHKIPQILKAKMNIYFAGKVEVKDEKVRVVMKKLYMEDQPIQPELLDLIIFIASKLQNTNPTSLYDWYDLPYGIKDIKTRERKAIFYY